MSTESDLKATVLSLLDDELNSDAELEIVHQNAEFSSSSKDEKLSSSTKKQQLTDTILRLMIDAIEQKLGKQEEKQETKKKAEGENKELEKEEWKSKEEEMKKKEKKTKDEEMKKEWKRKEEEWKQKTGAEEEEKKKREDEEGMKLSLKDDDVSEDVWTLEERVIYRWKDWKLIRTGSKTSKTDYLFIWSDAVVLRFNKNGGELFAFLMNGRLAWAANNYSWGLDSEQRQSEQKQPDYYYNDNAFSKTEFIGQLFRAKTEASKVGETMPILSVPRVFWQTIQFGEWLLSSGKAGTLLITHRRGTQLTIKAEDLRGFLFETKEHQKYLLRADPDWVLDI